jgi:hypothetical protein
VDYVIEQIYWRIAYTPALEAYNDTIKTLQRALIDQCYPDERVVWLAYRLMDEESKQIAIGREVTRFLPENLAIESTSAEIARRRETPAPVAAHHTFL